MKRALSYLLPLFLLLWAGSGRSHAGSVGRSDEKQEPVFVFSADSHDCLFGTLALSCDLFEDPLSRPHHFFFRCKREVQRLLSGYVPCGIRFGEVLVCRSEPVFRSERVVRIERHYYLYGLQRLLI